MTSELLCHVTELPRVYRLENARNMYFVTSNEFDHENLRGTPNLPSLALARVFRVGLIAMWRVAVVLRDVAVGDDEFSIFGLAGQEPNRPNTRK